MPACVMVFQVAAAPSVANRSAYRAVLPPELLRGGGGKGGGVIFEEAAERTGVGC